MKAMVIEIKTLSADEIKPYFKDTFESLFNRYQIRLETSMKGSDVIFDYFFIVLQMS